jgi:hypothetical protein
LILEAKERTNGMFIELYAFHYFIGSHIDLVKDVSTYNSVDSLIFSRANAIHCSTGLINSLRLSILTQ